MITATMPLNEINPQDLQALLERLDPVGIIPPSVKRGWWKQIRTLWQGTFSSKPLGNNTLNLPIQGLRNHVISSKVRARNP